MKKALSAGLLALAAVLMFAPPLHAADFGALVNGQFEAKDGSQPSGGDTKTTGALVIAPWVTVPVGEGDFYLSAGVNMSFEDKTVVAPELFRLEYSSDPASLVSLRLGRINWQDPSRLVAKGFFDGADVAFNLGRVKLGVMGLYTGFQYRETAEINISPTDTTGKKYDGATFEWDDFDSYFAPRRVLAGIYGEFPGFPAGRGHLYAGLLAQFDLSDADEAFHTQYLLLRHTLAYKAFDLTVAGAAELENTEEEGIKAAFAFSLEGGVQLSGAIRDRLSLGVSWASGEGDTAAFFPIVREVQGHALQPYFSGLMVLKAKYEARLLPSLSADIGGRYYIRNDATSFKDPYLEDESYPLGLELGAGLLWAPLSDLSFSLRGGVFLPKTGTAWADDTPVRWIVTAGTIISF